MNQLFQIRLAEAEQVLEQIYTKHNMSKVKKDFVSKLEIALKEASETGYWLELLHRTEYIDDEIFKKLSSKCTSLRVMLIASCKTAKETHNGQNTEN